MTRTIQERARAAARRWWLATPLPSEEALAKAIAAEFGDLESLNMDTWAAALKNFEARAVKAECERDEWKNSFYDERDKKDTALNHLGEVSLASQAYKAERDEARAEVGRLTRTYNARERTVSQLRDICDDIRSSLERQETEEWPGRAEKKRRHDEEHKAIVREAVVRALRAGADARQDGIENFAKRAQMMPPGVNYDAWLLRLKADEIEREGGK